MKPSLKNFLGFKVLVHCCLDNGTTTASFWWSHSVSKHRIFHFPDTNFLKIFETQTRLLETILIRWHTTWKKTFIFENFLYYNANGEIPEIFSKNTLLSTHFLFSHSLTSIFNFEKKTLSPYKKQDILFLWLAHLPVNFAFEFPAIWSNAEVRWLEKWFPRKCKQQTTNKQLLYLSCKPFRNYYYFL